MPLIRCVTKYKIILKSKYFFFGNVEKSLFIGYIVQVYCWIQAWIQPENSGCQQDFLLSEHEINQNYFDVLARIFFENFRRQFLGKNL